ncbi:mechanosensitive ion channel family protein [Alkalisalibacterium limincola]|uniref:Small-conductance mechanosensitive channel n=1 Tax=Alkalisalibacterium limincola TaxID=2699169 RepID=A0A5C8KYZ9_9GAMM|nr:mechanosensitive ion channel domain-containing protein [Alkalisalibacterium limincola]TXK64505.1 mechanosensitive ion channel [Alkalisalibacterium limincola]
MNQFTEYFAEVDWGTLMAVWGMRVVSAVLVLLLGLWLARLVTRLASGALTRAHFDTMLVSFLRRILYAAALVIVFVTVLAQLGVQTTSLLAVIGAAGLAIGLALQGSLANIAAGIMLIALRPFRIGDTVEVAGQTGVVEQVLVFHTVIKSFSNHEIILPNAQITSAPIVNFTALGQRRIEVPVGISYDADIRAAREVLVGLAKAHEKVLEDPAPSVMVNGLGDNSVDLTLRAFVETPDWAGTRSDLIEATHRELGKAGIGIPYPQRDVHLRFPDGVKLEDKRKTEASEARANAS